ncbi:MAG: UvrD-helicase domain-containing protein, partial [Haloechinothrix sp.]
LAPDDGSDIFLLLNVVPHDDAYTWAAKRLYTVNTATRALEVRDLGIDDQVLRAARAIADKPQLEAFGAVLPEDQFEVLQFLAEGFSPEEVYRDVVTERRPAGATADEVGSLAMAIVNTTSRITLVTGADELADILNKPFAAWRVFLHPSQRRVAYRVSFNGPAQVSGGPGTGKTVVALHRVKHLLSRAPHSRVLLTTFTNALAGMLRENLALLLDDEQQLARVYVTTVDAFANRVVRDLAGRVPSPITGADERQIWRRVRRSLNLPWTEQFLVQEFRHVILAQRVSSKGEYLRVDRRGRGSALRARQREELWLAMEAFSAELRTEGKTTHLQICAHAAELLDTPTSGADRYEHVVVDEAQDLHPAQWRVVRAAVTEGPDDLFITGDPHQRIYDSRVSLRALGIAVTGRSSRLRINYRSTAEILAWSTGVIDSSQVEELSGDGSDSLVGYRSLLHGTRPDISGHVSEHSEVMALTERVRDWIGQGVAPSEIAVCTRFNILLDKVHDRLKADGISAVRVKDRPGANLDGVRLASMHAMKGLEFRCVAVVGVTANAIPFTKEITRRKWTVSSTRAM